MHATKILRIPKPKAKDEIHTYFIAGDFHSYYCHEPSVKIMLDLAKDIPKSQRKLIINGDFLDCEEFMGSNLARFKPDTIASRVDSYYLPAAQAEADWGRNMLDRFARVFPEIYFVEGNHEVRISLFQKQYAPKEYEKHFDLKNLLGLKQRGIPFIGYNDWIDIGDVSITHGMFHGQTANVKHYNACGGSVIFNHVHQVNVRSFQRRGKTVMSWSNGCMSELNPEYMKNRENNWTNGFGVLNMRSSGHFNFQPLTIWDDILVTPNGKIYKG